MKDAPSAEASTISIPNGSVPTSSPTVTTDVALIAIQEAVNKVTGKSVPIARDTRMDRYFIEVAGTDSLEYLDLSFKLEAKLGI
jgi:acyl carrier protein